MYRFSYPRRIQSIEVFDLIGFWFDTKETSTLFECFVPNQFDFFHFFSRFEWPIFYTIFADVLCSNFGQSCNMSAKRKYESIDPPFYSPNECVYLSKVTLAVLTSTPTKLTHSITTSFKDSVRCRSLISC